jgi:OOP family OmpA-OmpF porin
MKTLKHALVAIAATAATSAAVAGPYFGVATGRSNISLDCTGTTSCEKRGSTTQMFGGMKFGDHWAFEGHIAQIGKAGGTGTTGGSAVAFDLRGTSVGTGGAYFLDFNDSWTGVVRTGIASVQSKAAVSSGTSSLTTKERHTVPYFGLGVSYKLTRALSFDTTFEVSGMRFAGESSAVQAVRFGLSYSL